MTNMDMIGKAVLWGISGSISGSGSLVGAVFQATDCTFDGNESLVTDGEGEPITQVINAKKKGISVDVVIATDTIANAKTNSILPEPGKAITIVDMKSGNLTGTFTCQSSNEKGSNNSYAMINIKGVKHNNINPATVVSL